jgi:hypothetical protein
VRRIAANIAKLPGLARGHSPVNSSHFFIFRQDRQQQAC